MHIKKILILLLSIFIITGCSTYEMKTDEEGNITLSKETLISDIINYPEFKGFGRLLFPDNIDNTYTVSDLIYSLKYHTNYSSDKTLEIINYLKDQVNKGNKVFYNIYTEEEMKNDPSLKNVGLIYFRGNSSKPYTIHMAGGWEYVGSIHDSFPQALELSKLGYNAFALIYRNNPNATNDLKRTIDYINEHKEELGLTNNNYSIWANAQASMYADQVSQTITNKPSALVMQYNNVYTVTGNEVPTYSIVGTADQAISYSNMELRNSGLKAKGIPAEIKMIVGLNHGFGLGIGTPAEGWINDALVFVEANTK